MTDNDGGFAANDLSAIPEDEEEDWFGEGSAFDSGEDLAAALFSLAGVPEAAPLPMGAYEDEATYEPHSQPSYGGAAPAITIGAEAFQVVDRPAAPPMPSSPAPSAWSVRPQIPGQPRTNWSMRHSVQFLKTTEEVIKKLRAEAIELTWQAAALALEQQKAPAAGKKR